MGKIRNSVAPMGNLKGYLAGLVSGIGINVVFSAVGAMAICSSGIPQEYEGYLTAITVLTASYIDGLLSAGLTNGKRVIACMLAGIIYYTTNLALGAIVFDGELRGLGAVGILVFCGCVLATMTGIQKRGARRWKVSMRNG